MRKYISHSFLLRWSIGVFLLAASLLPSAVGQSIDVPANIYVTNILSCGNTSFLNSNNIYAGGYDFFITGGYIFGNAAADVVPGCGSYPAPPGGLSGSVSVPPSGTIPSTPITSTAELTVDAYFNTPSCGPVPSGDLPLLYAPYSLSGFLYLANSETYYLSPFESGSVIPAGSGDPKFPFPTYPYVFGPNSVTHTEIPSVISVNFQCTNSGTLPHIQISYVSAYTSSPNLGGVDLSGTPKATLGGFTYAGPISLLVRSGNAYKLTVDYQTGTSSYSDLISWPPYVFNTSGLVPGCSVVTNSIGLNCSSGSPLGSCLGSTNSGATITGGFGMKNEFNWENTFFLEAYNGPVGNYRIARFTPLAPAVCPPYYTFTAINVVPSDFFVGQGISDQPYYLYGYLSFGTYSDFEYFQAPSYSSVEAVNCTTTNLDVFELCPGYVQGNITLTGPTYGSSPPSPWRSLILDNTTFGSIRSVSPATFTSHSGYDFNDPYLNPNSFSTSSSIGATGGRGVGSLGNGSARVLFSATTNSDNSTLSGSYDLRLAGLSSVTGVSSPSTWNPNQVNLNFYSLNLDNTVNMEETLQITDNTFINQTNTCGVTNNHDISYCFGEVLFPLVDSYLADTAYTAVSVSGSGTYTNTAGGVSYSTSFSAIGVVSNGNGSTTPNKGLFRLFLPQGPYTITTTVTKGGGTYNQPPVPIYVNCASSTFPTNQNSPVFSLTGLGNCYCGATTACATVNIINPTNDLMAVSYTINGGASVAVCTNCGITIPICFTLSPGANTIVITVTDLTTGFSTVLTQEVTCCQAPPIVTCPTNKAVQFGSGWTFDLPTASSCCGSNVTITSTSTVTNGGPCQPVITRTWQFTDACGNSNTCSQTVTVIPTSPCQVFNTGMSGTNAVAGGATDPNFVLVSEPFGSVGTSALVINPASANGSYTALPDDADSQWIGPEATLQFNEPSGVYHYQLQFQLCCTNTAELSGQMAADNTAGVYLNNTHYVGSISSASGFTSWTPISVTSGFVVGLNTLDIYVTNYFTPQDTNDLSPTAFRAELTICVFPFLVYCPTNKTVPCNSNWTFDPPTASSCCSSNVTITPLDTVTKGTCPHVITQTWRVTDGCSNRAICSQTVTVVPTPPILICASNKTVSGGLAWSFDPPIATNACCSNLTMCVLNIVTNASCNPCAINYTCTWRVTDCCTNAATCSQTVTVIPTSPCQVFNTGMNGPAALSGGAMDPNFNLVGYSDGALVINPADVPGSYLPDGPNSQWIGPDAYSYDESYGVDHYQLQFLLCCTNGAELLGQMAADNTATVYLNGTQVGSISASSGFTSWTPIFVNSGFVTCPLLNVLDIYVTNYFIPGDPYPSSPTAFRAELTNCVTPLLVHCPGDKGVLCGSTWAFDQPTASSCCGSNVVTTVLSTVTNGLGHITFTGGGSAANGVVDFVGNTATSGFLNITAGTKLGTYTLSPGSGSDTFFIWDGLIFPTSNPFLDVNGLLFTNSGVEINLYGNGPGSYTLDGAPPAYEPQVTNGVATLAVCPHMITRTWLFTDACGNSNTCSQTVTVVDTTPPAVTTAQGANATINCPATPNFTAPVFTDACSGVITPSVVTVTNMVGCTNIITRTWTATDGCGNTTNRSQTVTVNCCTNLCQPLCQDFNDNSLHGWQPDPAAPNVGVVLAPGGQAGASDYYVQVSDQSGASLVMAGSEFNGDWSCLCNKCANFCYDYTVISGGCPCPGDDRCTNAVNGHQNVTPSFTVTGCGGKSFTFVWTQFVVTEPGGSNPGWHRICAPVGPALNGGPPTSPSGHWVPGVGTSASDWCCVLGDVQKIDWSPDFTSCQSEVIGIDNVCWSFETNCVAPRCQDFNNASLNGWQPNPTAPNIGISVAQPGPSGSSSDYYVRVSDQSGPSLVMAGSEFYGDWSCYGCSTCCGEFSYDYRVFSDGCPCQGDPRCTNLVGGAQQIHPSFQVVGCNGKSFTFTWTYFAVTKDGGPNPGWHRITAPLGQVAPGSLPFSQYGVWTPGTGTTNGDWCDVLANVCKVNMSPDFSACQSEAIGIDNVCLSYGTNCADSSINKDFSNGTGQTADGIEIVLAGNFPASTVNEYPGPYWSGGIPQPNTTFPNFSVVASGTNTILRWSGQTFPSGAFAHVGFEVPGAPAQMLAVRWTSGGAVLGCAKQVNQHTWGHDNSVVFVNNLSLCSPTVLYIGNMAVEYSQTPVELFQLNSSVTNRNPLVSYPVPGIFRVPVGGTTNVVIPAGPTNATWGVLVYTVSSSPTLAGPGNSTDYTQVPLSPPAALPISDTLSISVTVSGGNAVIRWSSEGTLQSATEVTGPWTDVVGATSPYSVSTTGARRFFRVRLN